MVIHQVTPDEAHTALSQDDRAVYLDVRTEMEFRYGHAQEAINIPVAFPNPAGGLHPNAHFEDTVGKLLARDTPIFCGCQAGLRSKAACELLVRAGFTQVHNIQGGFGGRVDRTGVLVQPGWRDAGLPVSTEITQENSYAGLREKAGL